MSEDEFEAELDELNSAEDFLDYFGVAYDASLVQVNRLHILQRFHDYLAASEPLPEATAMRRHLYTVHLRQAYQDFVGSDARTEKVFRVFHRPAAGPVGIPLSDLMEQLPNAAQV